MSLNSFLDLEILLWFRTRGGDFERRKTPAVEESITRLQKEGMLNRTDFPAITPKGDAFMDHILNIPFPVQRWEIPTNEPQTT